MVWFTSLIWKALLPNTLKALVRIDAIKADGQDLKFDANKFHYGDLEGRATIV